MAGLNPELFSFRIIDKINGREIWKIELIRSNNVELKLFF